MFYQFSHLGSPEYLKIEKGRDFSFPPHLHQCFEAIIITAGEMNVTIDKKEYLLKKGEALLVFPNQIHSLRSKKSEHIVCIFAPALVQAFWNKTASKLPLNHKFIPHAYTVGALSILNEACSSTEKKGVLYSLCAQFDKTAAYEKSQKDTAEILHRIFSFVEENFSENSSLATLSAATGYDYSYLSKLFKKTVGISFNNYVSHYRLSRVCYLLENTQLSIAHIAFESGFSSLRSFNRNFKLHFNMTPTEFRNQLKK